MCKIMQIVLNVNPCKYKKMPLKRRSKTWSIMTPCSVNNLYINMDTGPMTFTIKSTQYKCSIEDNATKSMHYGEIAFIPGKYTLGPSN